MYSGNSHFTEPIVRQQIPIVTKLKSLGGPLISVRVMSLITKTICLPHRMSISPNNMVSHDRSLWVYLPLQIFHNISPFHHTKIIKSTTFESNSTKLGIRLSWFTGLIPEVIFHVFNHKPSN